MAKWQAPDPDLVQVFDTLLARMHGVERRQMFGCPCAFVDGKMFAGVHERRLFARLPAEAATHPFTPMGRASRTYAAMEDALDREAGELRDWMERALAYTRALPARAPRNTRRKTQERKK